MSVQSSRSREDLLAALSSRTPRTWKPGGIGPLWTLFTLSLRQFLRGRRAVVLLVLSLLPVGMALVVRSLDDRNVTPLSRIEFIFLFNLTPYALLPLAALLYGSGLILDEQEEQTLTYLLIRPLPKWGLYVTKLLAAICIVSVLVAAFVVEIYLAVYAGSDEWKDVFPKKILTTILVMALSAGTYVCVFGAMSLFVKRALIVGIIYIGVVEGIMSNFDFALRQFTVMYYFRVLVLNWIVDLDPAMRQRWSITLPDAASPQNCVLTLLVASVLATALAVNIFTRREFYVKTPES